MEEVVAFVKSLAKEVKPFNVKTKNITVSISHQTILSFIHPEPMVIKRAIIDCPT